MRILLDESLPRQLARLIPDHEVRTVKQMGWAGMLTNLPIPAIVLVAPTNRIESLQPLVPNLLKVLPTTKPGQVLRVGA